MFIDLNNNLVLQDGEQIMNGRGQGDLGSTITEMSQFARDTGVRWDSGMLRPYINEFGAKVVAIQTGELTEEIGPDGQEVRNEFGIVNMVPVEREFEVSYLLSRGMPLPGAIMNATTLRKDEWKQVDQAVLLAAKRRLIAWADARANVTLGGIDGMSTPIFEWERMTDPGEAAVDMDGMTEGPNFNPKFDLQGLPLPITHCDFFMSARFLAASRNRGQGGDTIRASLAGRRVAETIEETLIGTRTGTVYGDSTAYTDTAQVLGYTNHGDRNTKTDLTASASATGTTLLDEILAMIETLKGDFHYGPYIVYVSTAYDALLDGDFKANSDKTIRQRLREVQDIQDVKRLDFLTGDVILVVEMQSETIRAVNGMELTTVQWESMGGMRQNFKVMAIQVPNLRSDINGNMGLIHGTTA